MIRKAPGHCLLIPLTALLFTGCPPSGGGSSKGANPAANNAVGAGSRAKLRTTMKGIKKACQQYNLKQGKWPADMQELVDAKLWEDGKRADPWGNDYVIEAKGSGVSVLTFGADGAEGGTGADSDFSAD